MVIGYTEDQVEILDGDRVYTRSFKAFTESWNVLGNMAVIYDE